MSGLRITAAALLLVAPGIARAAVATTRPRLMVEAKGLPALRRRCLGPGKALLAAMKRRADGTIRQKPRLDNNGRHRLPSYAALYLVTGEKRYAAKAREYLDLLSKQTVNDPWTCLEYIPAAACAYDWVYPTMSAEERSRYAGGMIRQVKRIQKLWRHSDYNNHFLLEHMSALHVGLALAGEKHHQKEWRKYLADGEKWLKANVIPAMNEMAGDDGGDAEGFSYANWGVERPLSLLLLNWKTATGEDLFAKCGFMRWCPRWNIYGRRPDGSQFRGEDCPSGHRWGQGVKSVFAICAAQYRDRHAQWARDGIVDKYPQLVWRHLLSWDPEVRALGPEKLPLGAVFRPLGQVFTRSSWTDRDATWASFQCGPLFAGHQHLDNNSFVIMKRGSLAIDSGVNEYSSHRANYYSRSVAHNTVLVFDKGEQFPKAVWSSRGSGGSNDGGQRRVGYPTRATAPAARKAVRDVGRIAAFENAPEFCYALGDASKAYSPKKLRSFHRQFLHIRPDVFVVFDRVTATRADLPKTWLLHSVGEPKTEKLPGGASFLLEHGGGRLLGWTLLPRGAKTAKVGGPGKEYWVNGRNYPPDKKKDREAGAWRLEISPPKAAAYDVFLHVLHAGVEGTKAPGVKLLRATAAEVEVEITEGARKTSVVFACAGAPGGRITITRSGRKTLEKRFPAKVLVPKRGEGWGRSSLERR
jgi:hypothetical protein